MGRGRAAVAETWMDAAEWGEKTQGEKEEEQTGEEEEENTGRTLNPSSPMFNSSSANGLKYTEVKGQTAMSSV